MECPEHISRHPAYLLHLSLGPLGMDPMPLDAIPDLSDTQVIIYTEWPGRSPDLVEDQITYPISPPCLPRPKVQVVRGFSFLGSSFIYVIFEEGTDIYWARSRVLEYLQAVKNKFPRVSPRLGPDATSVGWGFAYALVDENGNTRPGGTALPPGLDPSNWAWRACRAFPSGSHRRVREAVPGQRGSRTA